MTKSTRTSIRTLIYLTLLVVGAVLLTASGTGIQAQTGTPIPMATLPRPTALPAFPTATPIPNSSESAILRIRNRLSAAEKPTLIIGIPYNIPPFSQITDTGDYEGFEADLAEAIAQDLGADLVLKQVTRESARDLLRTGQIDLLMGRVLLNRDDVAEVDYSDPIFASTHVALKLSETAIGNINDLGGQKVGVVVGTASDQALSQWIAASGKTVEVVKYAMMDEALRAMIDKQIVALVADRWELDQAVGNGRVNGVALIDGVFRTDPYAIAMRRYDDSLRILINRTLQRLRDSQRLDPIYDRWFPAGLMPVSSRVLPPQWAGIADDTRLLTDFETTSFPPDQSVIARIKAGTALRVAGLGEPVNAQGQTSPLEAFNRVMVEEMARRWGVTVEYIPASYNQGVELLANGSADIAVGLEARWGAVDRVDYVGVYAQRSYRIIVRAVSGSPKFTLSDLAEGIRNVGYYRDDPESLAALKKTIQGLDIMVVDGQYFAVADDRDAVDKVFNNNLRLVYGDAFRLIPLAQANSAYVTITERSYNPKPITFGVPYNDADFRTLVDLTLGAMAADGTYQRLWTSNFGIGDPLPIQQWAGTATEVFGVPLSR